MTSLLWRGGCRLLQWYERDLTRYCIHMRSAVTQLCVTRNAARGGFVQGLHFSISLWYRGCFIEGVGQVQVVESYCLWPEGPGFESRSPRIAQARVRLATNTFYQTPHRAGALCTGYALYRGCFIPQLKQGSLYSSNIFQVVNACAPYWIVDHHYLI